jgi:hypothetical protein
LRSLPGALSRESEDGQERTPPSSADALGPAVAPRPVGDPHVFMTDDVVRVDKLVGFPMVEGAPLVAMGGACADAPWPAG